MKRLLVILATVAALVGAAFASASSRLLAAPGSSSVAKLTPATPPDEIVLYGHVKSLARKGRRFEMRFDPAFWLEGVTAQRAAVEDKVIRPGEPVSNDYYIRDEGRRMLTYRVLATAHVTVLTRGIRATAITASELAQIVKGKNPKHRPLFDRRNALGFWIRVATDTVRSLDQQYQP